MASPSKLSLSTLTEAVAGGAVAIRSITRLLPAGGAVAEPCRLQCQEAPLRAFAFNNEKAPEEVARRVSVYSVAAGS